MDLCWLIHHPIPSALHSAGNIEGAQSIFVVWMKILPIYLHRAKMLRTSCQESKSSRKTSVKNMYIWTMDEELGLCEVFPCRAPASPWWTWPSSPSARCVWSAWTSLWTASSPRYVTTASTASACSVGMIPRECRSESPTLSKPVITLCQNWK